MPAFQAPPVAITTVILLQDDRFKLNGMLPEIASLALDGAQCLKITTQSTRRTVLSTHSLHELLMTSPNVSRLDIFPLGSYTPNCVSGPSDDDARRAYCQLRRVSLQDNLQWALLDSLLRHAHDLEELTIGSMVRFRGGTWPVSSSLPRLRILRVDSLLAAYETTILAPLKSIILNSVKTLTELSLHIELADRALLDSLSNAENFAQENRIVHLKLTTQLFDEILSVCNNLQVCAAATQAMKDASTAAHFLRTCTRVRYLHFRGIAARHLHDISRDFPLGLRILSADMHVCQPANELITFDWASLFDGELGTMDNVRNLSIAFMDPDNEEHYIMTPSSNELRSQCSKRRISLEDWGPRDGLLET